ncbi:MAG: molybdopterin-dependent oxidoreductase, partial [Raoultibacter sp.]
MEKETKTSVLSSTGISRRSFLAWSGLLGAGVALTGCTPSGSKEEPKAAEGAKAFDYDTVTWSGCHVNCGSRCPLQMYVKDGTVVRVGNDNEGTDDFGPDSIYQMRSCVRGRTNRQRIYNETRVEKPLRRVEGTKRGEGKYDEISWDEAIKEIANTMKEIKGEYGNDAFYIQYGTGQLGGSIAKSWHPDNTAFARLMNLWGGYLRQYSDYSTGQITWELPLFNGDAWSNNEVMDLVNSQNIVLFGNNPANTRMSGSGMQFLITQVRQQNPDARIIVVDPHLSDTAVGVANEWIPIRPGTDMALVAGMIHYLLSSGQLDESYIRQKFIGFYSDTFVEDVKQGEPKDTTFMGFDKTGELVIGEDMSYQAYLMGTGAYEGTGEKNPEWAAAITGVPADTIRSLADAYLNGPTATIQGWGPQRHSNGGNNSRAIAMIAAITKNTGISGGGTGAREGVGGVPYSVATALPSFPEKNTVDTCISFFDWFQAIEDYQSMTDATWGVRHIDETGATTYAKEPGSIKLKAPIKFIWNYGSNVMMGQHADINDSLRIYNLPDEKDSGLRMVVTVDCYLTPTALVSDIILPGTTAFEEDDIITGGTAWTGFVCCESAAIEPLFESKPVYEICSLLSEELGVKDEFTEGKSQLDWVKWCYEQGVEAGDDLPATFEEFRSQGLFKQTDDHKPAIAAADKIATPSG